MIPRYEFLSEVRGKGLMIGVEFGAPRSLKLKASWNMLESATPADEPNQIIEPYDQTAAGTDRVVGRL